MLLNLKSLLAARRLRQVDLALSLKLDPALLSKVINGRVQAAPGLRARLAAHLGVEESWLFSSAPLVAPRAKLLNEEAEAAPARAAS